tara:strand:- start:890 stop:1555 length:666 start_codon:yes stop_codon:yes gene_type:complete
MRGDVNVLKRVERDSRRADKAQSRLRKKLKQDVSGEATYAQRERCSKFARRHRVLGPMREVCRYRRRLLRCRTHDGRRVFYAAEFGGGLHNVGVGVVVAPACDAATVRKVIECVLKTDKEIDDLPMQTARAMPLLRTDNTIMSSLLFGDHGVGSNVCCKIVHPVDKGPPLFLLFNEDVRNSVCTVSEAGLDASLFSNLQNTTMKLLSLTEMRRGDNVWGAM